MIVFLFVLLAAFLVTLVSGIYCFFTACRRRKEIQWLDKEELSKTPYGKYYDLIVASDIFLKEHLAQDVYTNSSDGLRLHGYWIPAKQAQGTILLAHGYRSTKLVDFGLALPFYHEQGMNILLIEQRCHGTSEGKYITFGVKESDDVRCWIEFHNKQLGNYQLILSGLSMGASTVMFLADRELPDNVKGIIADCGFSSPKAIISKVFRDVTHLPAVPSIWVTEICARIFAGFSLYRRDTTKILAQNRYPIMMVHGLNDGFVPCEMTKSGYKVCKGNKRMLLVEKADHGLSFITDNNKYTQMIKEFLSENLDGFEVREIM